MNINECPYRDELHGRVFPCPSCSFDYLNAASATYTGADYLDRIEQYFALAERASVLKQRMPAYNSIAGVSVPLMREYLQYVSDFYAQQAIDLIREAAQTWERTRGNQGSSQAT